MKRLLCILALLCFAEQASAQVVALDLSTTKPGIYYFKVDLGIDGSLKFTPMPVVTLGGTPVPPVPTDLTERGKAVKVVADKITSASKVETAITLATFYEELSKQIVSGKISGDLQQLAKAIKQGQDIILQKLGATAEWAPVTKVVGDYWVKLQQEGASSVDGAKLLDEAAAGLRASVPQGQTQAIDIKKLMELIMMIIELLMKLFPV